jgi:hypothetical protein
MTQKELENFVNEVLAENCRLHTEIEIVKDIERDRVHKWYAPMIMTLKEWARKQSDEIKNQFFCIIANGSPSVFEHPIITQKIRSLEIALEKALKENKKLKEMFNDNSN